MKFAHKQPLFAHEDEFARAVDAVLVHDVALREKGMQPEDLVYDAVRLAMVATARRRAIDLTVAYDIQSSH